MAEEAILDEIEVVAGDAKVEVTKPTETNPNAGNTTDRAPLNTVQHTSDVLNTLSNGDLPWAIVAMPTTSAGQGGIGNNRHSLQPETWVYGIFLDGDACQQPLVLGVIPGGPGAAGSDGSGSSGSGGSAGSSSGDGGSSSSGSSGANNVGTSKVTISENSKIVYNVFRKGGFTHQQACGIMGNLYQESRFNPGARNNIKGGHDGIAQWDSTRWARFRRMYPGRERDVAAQAQYLVYELNGPEGKYGALIKAKDDVESATIGMANSERFEGWTSSRFRATGNGYAMSNSDLQRRIGYAKGFAKSMSADASTTPSTPSSNAGAPAKVKVTLTGNQS